jgi:hypothetical protein
MTWLQGYTIRAMAMALLTVMAVVALDCLSANLNSAVHAADANWWGKQEKIPYWANAIPRKTRLHITARNLAITIVNGRATAAYTILAPAKSTFIKRLTTMAIAGSGNDLVDNVLGEVRLAEFRYGFTGPQHSFVSFNFHDPQVSFNNRTATVSVTSDPIGLYFSRQYIELDTPGDVTVDKKGADRVHITPASLQTAIIPGGSRLNDTKVSGSQSVANLSRGDGTMRVTVAENGFGQSWLDGLRGIGGIEVPLVEYLFFFLCSIVVYIVLLWALQPRFNNSEELSQSTVVALARKAVLTVIGGLGAVAFLNFIFHFSLTVTQKSTAPSALVAGPVGLLVSGTLVAWPVACFRLRSSGQPTNSLGLATGSIPRRLIRTARNHLSWRTTPAFGLLHLAIACGYWIAIDLMLQVTPGAQVVAGTLAVTVLMPPLTRLLLGSRKLAVPLVSAGLLAGGLAATVAGPLLWSYGNHVRQAPLQVNVLGKCVFLVTAVAAVAGLIVMTRQVVAVLVKPRIWRRLATALIATGIAIAVIPDAAANVQISNPHATGLVPTDLFDLFDALPSLLDWLLVGLAIAVVAQLPVSPTKPDARTLARRLAFPIALTLLCWYNTWLYLPITIVIALVLLKWIVLPSTLVSDFPSPRQPNEARDHAKTKLMKALEGWRYADFAAGQRQALSTSGTETLRDLLMEPKPADYDSSLAALAGAQESLAQLRDRRQQDAGVAKAAAFAHYGDMPDGDVARRGAIAGAILGIIPAIVILLTTTPPSPNSGYAVLDFLGGTAWNLFQWTAIGWFVGYYLPLLKGRNGTEKALRLFAVAAVANLPISIMWDNQLQWAIDLTGDLELLIFLMIVSVYVCDLLPLKAAGFRPTDWVQVHNWRFVLTWSTALVAAVGTAAVTFLTVATTDLVNSTLSDSASQPASSSPANPTAKIVGK